MAQHLVHGQSMAILSSQASSPRRLVNQTSASSSCSLAISFHSPVDTFELRRNGWRSSWASEACREKRRGFNRFVAMVATSSGGGGAETSGSTALFAKEMERVAAKEGLLLAIKDAGGVEALTSGKGNESSKIEVSEKVLALERLNPTPRPTTSPLLEGEWDFVWAGTRSPGVLATRLLLTRFPQQLATLTGLSLQITEGGTKAKAGVKFLSSVETSVTVKTKIVAAGPMRLKEEYEEAVVSSPVLPDGDLPSVLKSVLDQIYAAVENLPASIKEAIEGGLKVSLAGSFSRDILISYLDDEILIARDRSGLPDVLVRSLSIPAEPSAAQEAAIEYES